jgi:hypothetical protein
VKAVRGIPLRSGEVGDEKDHTGEGTLAHALEKKSRSEELKDEKDNSKNKNNLNNNDDAGTEVRRSRDHTGSSIDTQKDDHHNNNGGARRQSVHPSPRADHKTHNTADHHREERIGSGDHTHPDDHNNHGGARRQSVHPSPQSHPVASDGKVDDSGFNLHGKDDKEEKDYLKTAARASMLVGKSKNKMVQAHHHHRASVSHKKHDEKEDEHCRDHSHSPIVIASNDMPSSSSSSSSSSSHVSVEQLKESGSPSSRAREMGIDVVKAERPSSVKLPPITPSPMAVTPNSDKKLFFQ